MGLGPDLCAQTGAGRPTGTRRPVAREGPVVRYLSDVRRFGSVEVAPDFRRRSGIRSLECVGRAVLVGRPAAIASVGWPFLLDECPGVGRPALLGRPVAEDFRPLLLLVLVLGVLASSSVGCGGSVAFL